MPPLRPLTLLLALTVLGTALAAPLQSRYTSLAESDCRLVSLDQESGSSAQLCPGLAGYGVLAQEGDLRQSLTLTSPDGRRWDLNMWSDGFSSLGPRIEWRGQLRAGRFVPASLIVRLNVSQNPEHPERTTPTLWVGKITPRAVCVTARISVSRSMNALARQAADRAPSQPCLKVP